MIRLGKRPPVPDTLKSQKVKQMKKSVSKKIQAGEQIRTTDFRPYWRENDVKTAIWRHHHKKCCYCERKRDLKRESDVEHFRPKAGVTEEKAHPGYWWLAYEWTNYLFSCKACNQEYKKNHFPLLPNGRRAFKEEDDLSDEKPVLIEQDLTQAPGKIRILSLMTRFLRVNSASARGSRLKKGFDGFGYLRIA